VGFPPLKVQYFDWQMNVYAWVTIYVCAIATYNDTVA
jgi:hypothetical protein